MPKEYVESLRFLEEFLRRKKESFALFGSVLKADGDVWLSPGVISVHAEVILRVFIAAFLVVEVFALDEKVSGRVVQAAAG